MTPAPLACSVRDCAAPLVHTGTTWRCARGHAFDVARHGYVNLLQPQDRKSAAAGDSRDAVDARARLDAAGMSATLVDSVVTRIASLSSAASPLTVVELGCGTGHLLRTLAQQQPIVGVGLDLSIRAIEVAARSDRDLQWVVANADRRLPIVGGSVDLVLSINARRNPAEASRVLRPGGHLLMAVPAEDDLIELREAVLGAGVERDRVTTLIGDHASGFIVVDRWTTREQHPLDRSMLSDLLAATYRGNRRSLAHRVETLDQLTVTRASELVVMRARKSGDVGM